MHRPGPGCLLQLINNMEYYKILRQKLKSEQLIMPSAIGAIVKDNEILLVKKVSEDKWSLPGGFQELNESIEETVIREIKEELNMDAKIGELISIFSSNKWITNFYDGSKIQQIMFFFRLVVNLSKANIVLQESELVDHGFFDLNNLPQNMPECCVQKCEDLICFKGKVFMH